MKEGKNGTDDSRIIRKDGCSCIKTSGRNSWVQNITSFSHHVLEWRWRYLFLLFFACYLLTWLGFGLVYYILCIVHPFETDSEPGYDVTSICIAHVYDFTTAFLFSLETQHTIGYGHRYVTHRCGFVIFVLCMHTIGTVIVHTLLAGIVVAKILRPKKRMRLIRFSSKAVLCQLELDGPMYFMFRIADVSEPVTHMIEAHVRVICVKKENSKVDGGLQPVRQYDMNVGYDNGYDRLLLLWPTIVQHCVDEQSPMYGLHDSVDSNNADYEIVVVFEGIVEATGMTTQARTSYTHTDILPHRRFRDMAFFDPLHRKYKLLLENLNLTYFCHPDPDHQQDNPDKLMKTDENGTIIIELSNKDANRTTARQNHNRTMEVETDSSSL